MLELKHYEVMELTKFGIIVWNKCQYDTIMEIINIDRDLIEIISVESLEMMGSISFDAVPYFGAKLTKEGSKLLERNYYLDNK